VPYGNYQYFDNLGNLYQITIPTDFANALGLPVATGNEPYLDPTISPRFVSYRSQSPQNQRQAIISTSAQFASPPSPISVGGAVYTAISFTGESVPALPFNLIQAVQGPQGAQGPQGLTGPAGSIAAIANNELVGNISGGSAVPVGLTSAQSTAILNTFSSSLKGLAPASGGGTANFLRADGSWASAGGAPNLSVATAVPTATGNNFFVHGLGRLPYSLQLQLVCQTANNGFSVGQVLYQPPNYFVTVSSDSLGHTLYCDSTNVYLSYYINGYPSPFIATPPSGTESLALTASQWKYQVAYL
jgi:hypothetical protein